MYTLQDFTKRILEKRNVWGTVESRSRLKKSDWKAHFELNKKMDSFGYSRPNKIGNLVDMLTNVYPCSQDDWEKYYKIRSEQAGFKGILTEIAYDLWRTTDFKFAPERTFSYVITRVLDETYRGVQIESLAKNVIQEQWGDEYRVRHAGKLEDRKYSIDFIVEGEYGIIAGYQVKPNSYFSDTVTKEKNSGLFRDRVRNCMGMMDLAMRLDDFESVNYLKEEDILSMEYNPISISFFNKTGALAE